MAKKVPRMTLSDAEGSRSPSAKVLAESTCADCSVNVITIGEFGFNLLKTIWAGVGMKTGFLVCRLFGRTHGSSDEYGRRVVLSTLFVDATGVETATKTSWLRAPQTTAGAR
jgi:hypothetical protein